MEIDDPYRELGLTPEASDAELKAAWRRLAARWHPDRNNSPQALVRVQRINRALEEIRRARGSDGAGDAGEAAPAPAAPPEDAIEVDVSVSLEEAACGCTRDVRGEFAQACVACSGSGVAPEPAPCERCGGAGRVRQTLWFTWLSPTVPCEACAGKGSIEVDCSTCDGRGRQAPRRYKGSVPIPAGVRHGQHLKARVPLHGRKGHQLLDVRVSLQPHELFTLADDGTIRIELPVDGFAWIGGRWVDVPTPHGLRQMRLQRGALTYRIRGAGIPGMPGGDCADGLVTVVPLFPADWSADQQSLLDQLVSSNTGDKSSDAGAQARAWNRKVAAWRARQTAKA